MCLAGCLAVSGCLLVLWRCLICFASLAESKQRHKTNADYREAGTRISGQTTDRLRDALRTANETEGVSL